MTVAERIAALLDRLGLDRVFIATQMPGDIADFCLAQPHRVGGLALVVASRIEPDAFRALADRLLVITGDSGVPAEAAARAAMALARCRQHLVTDYATTAWSDVAADRPDELCGGLQAFFTHLASPACPPLPASGTTAGLDWRCSGSGPALLLFPFFLAASQWDPVIDRLSRHFTVISLGGPHVGGAAMLEDRAGLAGYQDMFSVLLRRMAIPSDARVLEVGCGTAALGRSLLRTRPDIEITGVDLNGYLLREAAAIARSQRVSIGNAGPGSLSLASGDATDLPLPDAAFDAVYSVTVLEECDGDAALAEMVRVARPGAPVGVAVRAIDMVQWWNLDLPDHIAAVASMQPQSRSPGSIADRSLYRCMAAAGLERVRGFPYLLGFDRPDGPMWKYRAAHVRSALDQADRKTWDHACREAAEAGLLFQANPLHCAVGWRPAGATPSLR